MSYISATECHFKNINEEIDTIQRDDMTQMQEECDQQLVDMICKTINKAIELVNTSKSFNVGGHQLISNPHEITFEECIFNSQTQNAFIYDKISNKTSYTASDTNTGDFIITAGACHCSRMISDRMIGEQPEQQGEEEIHNELSIVHLILPHQFVLREVLSNDKTIQYGKEISFPTTQMSSEEYIPIGLIEGGIESEGKTIPRRYHLFDRRFNVCGIEKQQEICIGAFNVYETGNYVISLHDYLSDIIPQDIIVGDDFQTKKDKKEDSWQHDHLGMLCKEKQQPIEHISHDLFALSPQECKIPRCTQNQIEMRPISLALAP